MQYARMKSCFRILILTYWHFCLLPTAAGLLADMTRIAFAVQGGAAGYKPWCDAILLSSPSSELFYLTFDQLCPAPTHRCRCTYVPNSTWTEGRNHLITLVLRAEVEIPSFFKYWVFADDDMIYAKCQYCSSGQPICCLHILTSMLLLPSTNFATVATNSGDLNSLANAHLHEYYVRDCSDAMLQAFHREAVPVLLPYITEYDKSSWWLSQQLLFHFQHSCLKDSNVVIGGFVVPEHKHRPYPRAVLPASHFGHFLNTTFPELYPMMSANGQVAWLDQGGNCASQFKEWYPVFGMTSPGRGWQTSEAFRFCSFHLERRWRQFVAHQRSFDHVN